MLSMKCLRGCRDYQVVINNNQKHQKKKADALVFVFVIARRRRCLVMDGFWAMIDETSNYETINDKVEMPKIKTVRMSEPIIEEWESDSEDDEIVVKPKEVTKTVKPSFEKIKFVNARNEIIQGLRAARHKSKVITVKGFQLARFKKREVLDGINKLKSKDFVFELIVHWKQQVKEEGLVTRGLLFWELIKVADAKEKNKSGEQKFVLDLSNTKVENKSLYYALCF
ncbi:hypothetical protein Tco_1101077 [Tanacetum coccineum]